MQHVLTPLRNMVYQKYIITCIVLEHNDSMIVYIVKRCCIQFTNVLYSFSHIVTIFSVII